jgi:arylsulfatase A
MVCTIDLAASFAAMTDTVLPDRGFLDSFDVSDAMLGVPDAKVRGHLIQQDNGQSGNFGFREGKWKLTRHDSGFAFNSVVEKPLARSAVPKFMLFDLESDPNESKNIIESHPEMAGDMIRSLEGYIKAGRSRP